MQAHPFAKFIRILGRGRKGARSLSQEEAEEAMGMILAGHVEPEQLGAFLMLIRVKEETPEEVAGFVRAVRRTIQLPGNLPPVQLDWSSYAGKRRHLPWFLLSLRLLADNGIKIFVHGLKGRKDDRLYTPDALAALGVPLCNSLADAAQRLEHENFAYLNLEHISPRLQQLIELREILGLRSPVHTVARLLNPFSAPCQMQGIFHPGYLEIHQGAARLLAQPHMAVIKGDGGEIEASPDGDCRVLSVHEGTLGEARWPPLLERRGIKPKTLAPQQLAQLWNGTIHDAYGTAAVINTAAVTLYMMGRQDSREAALDCARCWWQQRTPLPERIG